MTAELSYTDEQVELLPCPFCGCDDDIRIWGRDGCFGVCCCNCGADTRDFRSKERAAAGWNRRSTIPPVPGRLAATAAEAELASATTRLAALEEALEPFAAVLVDVGEDETDDDLYAPMSPENRRAPAITVGFLRRARQALAAIQEPKP